MDSFWYPSAVPIRVIILLGFLNAFVMFMVNFIRRVIELLSGKELLENYKGEDL